MCQLKRQSVLTDAWGSLYTRSDTVSHPFDQQFPGLFNVLGEEGATNVGLEEAG